MPVATRAQKRKREEEGRVNIGDFPLELIEKIARHLDQKDVPKLMMTNKRLYSFYSKDQSIVFGVRVKEIHLGEYGDWIKKFDDSDPFDLGAYILPFIKRVASCDKVELWAYEEPINAYSARILKQLESVNHLELAMNSADDFKKFFANLRASVKEYAQLNDNLYGFEEIQSMKAQFGNFIETHLTNCEKIELTCDFEDFFKVCYKALAKTETKMIRMNTSKIGESIIQSIVKQGIPNKNSDASFWVSISDSSGRHAEIVAFLKKYSGMTQIDPKIDAGNCLPRFERTKKLFDDVVQMRSNAETLCFRRKIESTKDAVYLLQTHREYTEFFTFYIPIQ